MKLTAYPSVQIKLSALRTKRNDSILVAVAAFLGLLLFGTILSLTSFQSGLLLRAILFGNLLMCSAVALCYSWYAVSLRRKYLELSREAYRE